MSMSISCAATQLRIQLLLRAPLNARAIDQQRAACTQLLLVEPRAGRARPRVHAPPRADPHQFLAITSSHRLSY